MNDLPVALRTKLSALVQRIRLLRILRGMCCLVLVILLSFLTAFVADRWFNLSDEALAVVLAGMLGLGITTVLLSLIMPLCRRISPETLAAVIENRYPELGERLLSSVAMAGKPRAAHGSPGLIALLLKETDARARPLAFGRAFSVRTIVFLVGACIWAAVLALLPALVQGKEYGDFGRRLLLAWFPADPYTVHVEPGDQVVAVDRFLTVSARIVGRDEHTALPETCSLVLSDTAGQVRRVPMPSQAPGSFTHTFKIAGNMTYQVESGRAVSDWYQVTAVEPVKLVPGSPMCRVTPPSYVNEVFHPEQTLSAPTELSVLEYSRVRLDFRFNRPAQATALAVIARESDTKTVPVRLLAAGKEASAELPALAPGNYVVKLFLEAEHNITTAYDLLAVTVWGDGPPSFAEPPRVVGQVEMVELHRALALLQSATLGLQASADTQVAPNDTLPLKVGVEDKVGVDRAELEYRINDGQSRLDTIFQAKGAVSGSAEYLFELAGKVQHGDVLRYRIRAADNRRIAKGSFKSLDGKAVPEHDLGSQFIYYPERTEGKDRWIVVRINWSAEPVPKQEILAERDKIKRQIEAIRQRLHGERAQLAQVRKAAKIAPALAPQQTRALGEALRENSGIVRDLFELAKEAVRAPLLDVADRALGLAEGELARSDQALRRAQDKKAQAAARDQQLHKADEELASALKRLEDLQQINEQAAQNRLAALHMEKLAQRQADLGRRAADLADRDLRQPRVQDFLKGLRAEQEQVAAAAQRLAEQSPLFRNAVAAARAAQARKLAEMARALAKAQRALIPLDPKKADASKPAKQSPQEALQKETGELAGELAKLARMADLPPVAKQSAQIGVNLAQSAQAAMQQARQAAKPLAQQAQERAAQNLDMVAHQAMHTANQIAPKGTPAGQANPQAGRAVQDGQQQTAQAQTELAKGQTQGAQATMQQAAQSLRQAAKQSAQRPGNPQGTNPGPLGAAAGGTPDQQMFAKDLNQYAGKSWGQLPGELRTRIVQDMRARYGEEYAAIIQRYFERLAGGTSGVK